MTGLAPPAGPRLSRKAARALTDEARRDFDHAFVKLERLYDGAAHLALGYRSWATYCKAEFNFGRARSYQLLVAGRVFEAVHNCGLEPLANEAQARALGPLLGRPDLLAEVVGQVQAHGPLLTAENFKAGVAHALAADHHRAASLASRQRRRQRRQADAAAAGHGHADFHLGNFRDHIDTLRNSSVGLLLTDPPYGINFRGRPYFFQDATIPGDKTPKEALSLLADALESLRPKLARQAHVLVFTSWRYEPNVRRLLEQAGLTVRSGVIWDKGSHGVGACHHSFGPAHERIVHASCGNARIRLRDGDVYHHRRVKPLLHPTQKPLGLLAELIRATLDPGKLVCDPFAGVASTLLAATLTGRNAWGCELTPDWHTAGLDRLQHPDHELDQLADNDKHAEAA